MMAPELGELQERLDKDWPDVRTAMDKAYYTVKDAHFQLDVYVIRMKQLRDGMKKEGGKEDLVKHMTDSLRGLEESLSKMKIYCWS